MANDNISAFLVLNNILLCTCTTSSLAFNDFHIKQRLIQWVGLGEGTATASATVTRIITPPQASLTLNPEVPGPRKDPYLPGLLQNLPKGLPAPALPQGPSVLHPAVREPTGTSPLSGCLPIQDLPWLHAFVESKILWWLQDSPALLSPPEVLGSHS